MKKKVLLIVMALVCCGFASNAQAQILDFLNKAAQTASQVAGAVNDVKSISNANKPQTTTPSYNVIGSVSAKRFNSNSVATTHVDVVRTSGGEDKVLKNGSLYSICENYSYNVYCTDPKSSAYYKYYFNAGGAYYFNW